jgi:shikimate kinase
MALVFENTVRRVNKCLETGGGNVTCNFMYSNHLVHTDFMITLYTRCEIASQRLRNSIKCSPTLHNSYHKTALHQTNLFKPSRPSGYLHIHKA